MSRPVATFIVLYFSRFTTDTAVSIGLRRIVHRPLQMSKPSILFLQHEFDNPLAGSRYIAALLKQNWEQNGYPVQCVRGVREQIPADLLFVHIDVTVVTDEYLDFMSHYPVVINGRVTDISKDRISSHLLQRGDEYPGPVIVKTKANFGGRQDLKLMARAGLDPLELDLHQRPWRKIETLDSYDYPVFDSPRAVPPGVWKNPRLVVEKFVAERNEDGHYVMRNWFFLGDEGFTRSVSSPHRIVKPSDHPPPGRETHLHFLDEPIHPGLHELRKNLGFDHGRFDYVMADGQPVVFDANTTPVIVEEGIRMHEKQFLEDLPKGLLSFL